AQSSRARLEGRVPGAAVPVLDSLVQRAVAEGLPTEPLIQKALEGGAKQVTASRIVAAVQLSLGQLRAARDLLIRAGDEPPVTRGHTHAEALALVRQQLPNVPASPKPTRSAVARARRPAAPPPP